MKHEFEATLERMGPSGGWTCVRIPFDVPKAFGSKARVAVRGRVNGFEFRSSAFPDGEGGFFLIVNGAMRKGAGVTQGETARFSLERDDAPREVEVPPELAAALAAAPGLKAAYDSFGYSHRKQYADWVGTAKRAGTRQERAAKVLDMIAERKRLP